MLCPVCHRQLARTDARCRACGTPRDGAQHLDLLLPGGERVPLDRPLTVGRSPASQLRLEDASVSRSHAAIELDAERGALIRDAGSSYGTYVNGKRVSQPVALGPGMRIQLGDYKLEVAERLDRAAAGHTISVPAGVTVVVERPGVKRSRMAGHAARKPRLRSGWSLKRLDESEGPERYVLKDHRSDAFMRLGEQDAELAQLLDGEHELVALIGAASDRCGSEGPARLARLLAELADRGMLANVEEAHSPERKRTLLERLLKPHERELPNVPRRIATIYRRGGFLPFTRPVLALLAAIAAAGLVAFVILIANRYGTPFVVAKRVGLGALVFVVGRLLLVVCHELAHGLLAESFGRPVSRAGIKVALVFPYVFVDTTDAWFESRRRRMLISLAGPASDITLGGAFALACLLSPKGSARDVLFQVAFGGYVGALFNLNPLLERDGYHVLVDLLGEPGLRRRASKRLTDVLSGHAPRTGERKLLRYGIASLCWSAVAVVFAVVISLRYYHPLASLVPPALVWTVLAAFYLVLALPLALALLRPLWSRLSGSPPSVRSS
jgi:putative peptide zinc metalloprotease protein